MSNYRPGGRLKSVNYGEGRDVGEDRPNTSRGAWCTRAGGLTFGPATPLS